MPITGPTSYLSTTDEFITHWSIADTRLGAGNEITLPEGVVRAGLQTLRTSLDTKQIDVQAALNVQETARGAAVDGKTAMLLRLNQFNEKVRALYADSKWDRALPNIPGETEGEGTFTKAMNDTLTLWQMMNADAAIPDIVLLGGFTHAQFATAVTVLKTAFTAYSAAGTVLNVSLGDRNDTQNKIYEILKNYRRNLPTHFAKNDVMVTTLPRLTPEPGSTPDPVVADGGWTAIQQLGRLHSTASTDQNLQAIEWRFCVGPVYSTDNESVVPGGHILAGGNLEIFTLAGLPAEGSVATFRAYVITTTGNEKGSNTITITRLAPAPPPPPPPTPSP